jgi:hypothetical protein
VRTATFVTMLITGFMAQSLFADWQGQSVKGSLLDRLRAEYPLTVMDAGGIKVVRPGAVLVVQQNGLQANPLKSEPFKNKFEDGQVSAGTRKLPGVDLPNIPFMAKPRYLAVNEKVYLLNLEIKGDARGDVLALTVQTCGTCDPSAADSAKPYHASISFNFYLGFLAATDFNHVQSVIGSLLALAYVAPAVSAPPAPQAAQQDPGRPTFRHADEVQSQAQTQTPVGESTTQPAKFPDLTPPPPPPPPVETKPATQAPPPTLLRPDEAQAQARKAGGEPAAQPVRPPDLAPPAETKPEIKTDVKPETKTAATAEAEPEIGWTRDRVEAALGKPGSTEKSRGQEIYLYKHVKVTLVRDKVAAIESIR